jgi:hypothetical protein
MFENMGRGRIAKIFAKIYEGGGAGDHCFSDKITMVFNKAWKICLGGFRMFPLPTSAPCTHLRLQLRLKIHSYQYMIVMLLKKIMSNSLVKCIEEAKLGNMLMLKAAF